MFLLLSLVWVIIFSVEIQHSHGREIPVFYEIKSDEGIATLAGTERCIININEDLGNPQPLLIVPNKSEFYVPQNKIGDITLQPDEQIELFCSEKFKFPESISDTIVVSCIRNSTVLHNKLPIDFKSIKCDTNVYHTTRPTYQLCFNDSYLIQIGFNVSNGRFLDIIDVCFNTVLETTLYTHHIQMPQNIGFQHSVPRPHFIRGQYFKKTPHINKLFNKNKQKTIFEQTLGHSNISQYLSDEKKSLFLVRGHLTPKVDFIFGSQQRATFWLINAAPQWQSFNAGNWERIEQGVRQLIADRDLMVNIFTGTYGVLAFNDSDGKSNPIFLFHDQNNNSVVPVPKLFYKIVLDMNFTSGVALIGANNPFATIDEIEEEYVVCDDVADQLDWLKWDRKNIVKGYTYACEVDQFLEVIRHLSINVTNISLLV
ncbi:hypothetical protein Bhyg_00621 [Pseudolycoriella hygida]|uniref:DNA/RNA non-specific endonuclease domain-containing protein n=1 Tax=Pseudolycoriella hygida TaxID=35572 RepID=A0A9Q0S6R5_9DIPT|nr:hypothetical protein Bhyg_00621 [Pseudolycoriella hygida]